MYPQVALKMKVGSMILQQWGIIVLYALYHDWKRGYLCHAGIQIVAPIAAKR